VQRADARVDGSPVARARGDRPLRIALFHTRLPEPGRKLGGVEIGVHRLANALVDLGQDEVTVVSATGAPADARYRSERIIANMPFIYRRSLPQVLVVPVVLNFFDFGRFDVVHLHGDDWFYFRRPVPTVRTLNGSALREAQSATTLGRRGFMYGVYAFELLSTWLAPMAVGLGKDTAAIYGLDETVSLGVDEAVFHPGPKAPKPRVLYVGLWEGRKRGRFVYETFLREVLPRVPDAQLCVVSDYCPSHPSVLGEVFPDDARLAQLYREAWVFASGSTYEGFGIPYVEALASGTAVVATPNPGSREILDEGKYGILAPDEAFGAAVADLLESEQRRQRLAADGLSRAHEYSWRAVARHHRDLYMRAVADWEQKASR
jgi:glycosyltransferase involved in cell wall biosynthesis